MLKLSLLNRYGAKESSAICSMWYLRIGRAEESITGMGYGEGPKEVSAKRLY